MTGRLERKNSIETISEAIEWLRRNAPLGVAFLVVGVVSALGEELALFSLFGLLLFVFVAGIAHRIARAEAAGERTDLGSETGPVLNRFLSLLGAYVAYSIAIFVGSLLLIVPGIYLALRLSLAFPAIVIDDQGTFEGLNTSWEVAHGNLLKLLGISILSFLVLFSTVFAAAIFAALAESTALVVIVSAVVTAIVTPIAELSYARVYLENREGEPAAGWTETASVDSRRTGREPDWGTDDEHGWSAGSEPDQGSDDETGRRTDDRSDDRDASW